MRLSRLPPIIPLAPGSTTQLGPQPQTVAPPRSTTHSQLASTVPVGRLASTMSPCAGLHVPAGTAAPEGRAASFDDAFAAGLHHAPLAPGSTSQLGPQHQTVARPRRRRLRMAETLRIGLRRPSWDRSNTSIAASRLTPIIPSA